jgi:hypothetical protein
VRAKDRSGFGGAQIVGREENFDLSLLGKGENCLTGGLGGEIESDGSGADE